MRADRNGTASRVGDESRHEPRDRITLRFVGPEHPDTEAAATRARHRNLCSGELNLDARKIDEARARSGYGIPETNAYWGGVRPRNHDEIGNYCCWRRLAALWHRSL